MRADPDGPGLVELRIRPSHLIARMTAVEFTELRPTSTLTPAWLDTLALDDARAMQREIGEADTLEVTRPDEP